MTNLNTLENFRTKKELINYFEENGQTITEEEIEALKQSYEQAEENDDALSLQQLDYIAGGGPGFLNKLMRAITIGCAVTAGVHGMGAGNHRLPEGVQVVQHELPEELKPYANGLFACREDIGNNRVDCYPTFIKDGKVCSPDASAKILDPNGNTVHESYRCWELTDQEINAANLQKEEL